MPIVRTLEWPIPDARDGDARRADAVGQWEWTNLIPTLHRALANPAEHLRFPAFRRDFALPEACAYWESAWYLMRRLLGWKYPGLGLHWWYSAGKPLHDDARLALLAELFDDRQQLDPLAMWAWSSYREIHPPQRHFVSEEFVKDFFRRYPGYGVASDHDPYWGGSNSLHLGHSCIDDPDVPLGSFVRSKVADRRATLVVDEARHWHAALVRHGTTLSRAIDWRVEVIVPAIGWLGVFRRSWDTGEWFQGKHSIHMKGCAPQRGSRSAPPLGTTL